MSAPVQIGTTSATSAYAGLPLRREADAGGSGLGALVLLLVLFGVALVVWLRAAAKRGVALPRWLALPVPANRLASQQVARLNARVSLHEITWQGETLLLAVEDAGSVQVLSRARAAEPGAQA